MSNYTPYWLNAGNEVWYKKKPVRVKSVQFIPDPEPYWAERGQMVIEVTLTNGSKIHSLRDFEPVGGKKKRGRRSTTHA